MSKTLHDQQRWGIYIETKNPKRFAQACVLGHWERLDPQCWKSQKECDHGLGIIIAACLSTTPNDQIGLQTLGRNAIKFYPILWGSKAAKFSPRWHGVNSTWSTTHGRCCKVFLHPRTSWFRPFFPNPSRELVVPSMWKRSMVKRHHGSLSLCDGSAQKSIMCSGHLANEFSCLFALWTRSGSVILLQLPVCTSSMFRCVCPNKDTQSNSSQNHVKAFRAPSPALRFWRMGCMSAKPPGPKNARWRFWKPRPAILVQPVTLSPARDVQKQNKKF